MTAENRIAAPADPPPVPPTPRLGAHFRRLGALAPLGLRHDACLHLHKTPVGCRRCRDACPHACIELVAGGLDIDAGRCTACGRCASACPTAALAVDGFALEALPASRRLACHRQGPAASGAAQVPCLGGLDRHALLRLVARVAPAPLQLLDDGSCAGCPEAAGRGHPGVALLDALRPLLTACGLSEAQMPALHTALPNGNATQQPRSEAAAPAPNAARRGFFAGLGRAVSGGIARRSGALPAAPERLPAQPRHALPYTRGYEMRQLLTTLAGDRPATAWLPGIELAAACAAHQSCVRLCPTGALQAERVGSVMRLSFDAWLCIECGVCSTACPSGALRYSAPAERAFPLAPVVLASVELDACRRCGGEVAKSAGEALCSNCRKSESLAQAGFALFAALRPPPPNAAGPP